MDVGEIFKLLWRRKLVVIPALFLGISALGYTYKIAPPTYRVTASQVLLVPPPPPPTSAASSGNPLLRLGDMSLLVDIISRAVTSPPVLANLRAAGGTGTLTIGANEATYRSAEIDVQAEGKTPEEATRTSILGMSEVAHQLQVLQTSQGIDKDYYIKVGTVLAPGTPTTVFSSTLRRMIAVGVVVGIFVLSVAVAVDTLAVRRARRRNPPGPDDEPVAVHQALSPQDLPALLAALMARMPSDALSAGQSQLAWGAGSPGPLGAGDAAPVPPAPAPQPVSAMQPAPAPQPVSAMQPAPAPQPVSAMQPAPPQPVSPTPTALPLPFVSPPPVHQSQVMSHSPIHTTSPKGSSRRAPRQTSPLLGYTPIEGNGNGNHDQPTNGDEPSQAGPGAPSATNGKGRIHESKHRSRGKL